MGRLRAGESFPLREEPRPRFVVGARKKAATARASAGVHKKSMGSGSSDAAIPPPPRMRPPERAAAEVVDVKVEDTDALECGVCFVPLKPPIFQCNAGHVVCSVCRDELKATGKCHVCGVTTGGYSRCHAMERLVESIHFQYPNAAYGCTAWPVYHDMEDHRWKCPHTPCCCPDKACGFVGSTELLLDHFSGVHGWPCTTALANEHFKVSLQDGFNFLFAEGHDSSSPCLLFLLNVARRGPGLAISVLGIHPHAAANGQGAFSKEATECQLTYSRYVKSKNRRDSDQLTHHYQRCKFRVAFMDLSDGLRSPDDHVQFVVPNFALGENKETIEVQGRIVTSSYGVGGIYG